jgi:hypothetical protein
MTAGYSMNSGSSSSIGYESIIGMVAERYASAGRRETR